MGSTTGSVPSTPTPAPSPKTVIQTARIKISKCGVWNLFKAAIEAGYGKAIGIHDGTNYAEGCSVKALFPAGWTLCPIAGRRAIQSDIEFAAIVPPALHSKAAAASKSLTAVTLQTAIQQTIAANPAFNGTAQPQVVFVSPPSGTLHQVASGSSSSSNTKLIIGLAVGLGGCLLLVVCCIAVFVFKRQKQPQSEKTEASETSTPPPGTSIEKDQATPSLHISRTRVELTEVNPTPIPEAAPISDSEKRSCCGPQA
jgi:hypothetical protein